MEMALNMLKKCDTAVRYAQVHVQRSAWDFCITRIHVGGKDESLSG